MATKLMFDMGATLRLAALTRIALFHRPSASMLSDRAIITNGQVDASLVPPHLQLIHRKGEGVYLRSSAIASAIAPVKVYADGYQIGVHPGAADRAIALFGQDDCAEVVPVEWVDLAMLADPTTLVLTLEFRGDSFELALPPKESWAEPNGRLGALRASLPPAGGQEDDEGPLPSDEN